jgi:hypothetical protein
MTPNPSVERDCAYDAMITSSIQRSYIFLALATMLGVVACSTPTIVHVTDPESPCARLRVSYPSEHGLVLFTDTSTTSASIPWCFPGTEGTGVMGYNVNVPVVREGTLTLTISDIRPPRIFGAVSVDASCSGNATGKIIRRLGYGTTWSMHVVPGNYCISLIPDQPTAEDTWFSLAVERP